MKKIFLAISLIFVVTAMAPAQKANTRGTATAGNDTSAKQQNRQIDLQSGTQLAAQLEGSLDARHAKPGDRVVLRTTQAVKQNGQVVVQKGALLIGHVTDVQQQTKSNAESHIGVLFDRLRSGSTETPITASILSITQARTRAQNRNADMETDTMAQSSASTRSSGGSTRSNGGLLGGVGSTVGGVLNTTTSTIGNAAGNTTGAVGSTVGATTSTAGNLTGSLSGLQITQSSSASAEGGSTLSLTGRNLHLESGTTFNLLVSNSTSAGSNP
jgi:hypothetical protein